MKLLEIGITGGIGSGKTYVCGLFRKLGVPIYEADTRAHWLMENSPELQKKIIDNFGEATFTAEGKLNRPFLAQQVFHDAQKIALLESWVHPAVAEDYRKWVEEHRQAPYLLKEAALLFEAGSYRSLDAIIVVVAPRQLRIERIRQRDPQRSLAQIEAIIEKQMPDELKRSLATYLIDNSLESDVEGQVQSLHQKIIALNCN
jgi:dephospho-CoA kinase